MNLSKVRIIRLMPYWTSMLLACLLLAPLTATYGEKPLFEMIAKEVGDTQDLIRNEIQYREMIATDPVAITRAESVGSDIELLTAFKNNSQNKTAQEGETKPQVSPDRQTWEAEVRQHRIQELILDREESLLRGSDNFYRHDAKVKWYLKFLRQLALKMKLSEGIIPGNEFDLLEPQVKQQLSERWEAKVHAIKKMAASLPSGVLERPLAEAQSKLKQIEQAGRGPGIDLVARFFNGQKKPENDPDNLLEWIKERKNQREPEIQTEEEHSLKKAAIWNPDKKVTLNELRRKWAKERADGFRPNPSVSEDVNKSPSTSEAVRELLKNRFSDPLAAIKAEAALKVHWQELREIPDSAIRTRLLPEPLEKSFPDWVISHLNDADLLEVQLSLDEAQLILRKNKNHGINQILTNEQIAADEFVIKQEAAAIERELDYRSKNHKARAPQIDPMSEGEPPRRLLERQASLGRDDLLKTPEGRQTHWEALRRFEARTLAHPEITREILKLELEGYRDQIEGLERKSKKLREVRKDYTKNGLAPMSEKLQTQFEESSVEIEKHANLIGNGMKKRFSYHNPEVRNLLKRLFFSFISLRGPPGDGDGPPPDDPPKRDPDPKQDPPRDSTDSAWRKWGDWDSDSELGSSNRPRPPRPPGSGGVGVNPSESGEWRTWEGWGTTITPPIKPSGGGGFSPYGDAEAYVQDKNIDMATSRLAESLKDLAYTPIQNNPFKTNLPKILIEGEEHSEILAAREGARVEFEGWKPVDGKLVEFDDIYNLRSKQILPGGVALGQLASIEGDWKQAGLVYVAKENRLMFIRPDGHIVKFPEVDPRVLKACYLFARSPDPVAVSIGYTGEETSTALLRRTSKVMLHPELRDTQLGLDIIDADRLPWSLRDNVLPNGAANPIAEEMRLELDDAVSQNRQALPVEQVFKKIAPDIHITDINTIISDKLAEQCLEIAIQPIETPPSVLDLMIETIGSQSSETRFKWFVWLLVLQREGVSLDDNRLSQLMSDHEFQEKMAPFKKIIEDLPPDKNEAVQALVISQFIGSDEAEWDQIKRSAFIMMASPKTRGNSIHNVIQDLLELKNPAQISLLTDKSIHFVRNGNEMHFEVSLLIRYVRGELVVTENGLERTDKAVEHESSGKKATANISKLAEIYPALARTREYAAWIALMHWAIKEGNVAWLDLSALGPIQHRTIQTPDYLCRGTNLDDCMGEFGVTGNTGIIRKFAIVWVPLLLCLLFMGTLRIVKIVKATKPGAHANVLEKQSDHQEAKQEHQRSSQLKNKESTALENYSEDGASLHDVSNGIEKKKHHQQAAQERQQSLQRNKQVDDTETPPNKAVSLLLGMANVFVSQERFPEAEQIYRRVLEINKQVYSTDRHPSSLPIRSNLASILAQAGRMDAALTELEIALEIARSHRLTFDIGNILFLLAQIQLMLGDVQGVTTALEAHNILQELLGTEHPMVKNIEQFLTMIFSAASEADPSKPKKE